MDFCTQAQIVARIPALSQETDLTPFQPAIDEGIAFGTDEICFFLGNKYPNLLELAQAGSGTVPRWLSMIAADLAASFILTSNLSGGGEDKPPALALTYETRARSKMRGLGDGTLELPGAQGDAPDQLAPDAVAYHTHTGQTQVLNALDYIDEVCWDGRGVELLTDCRRPWHS